jgi:hypothetical protein
MMMSSTRAFVASTMGNQRRAIYVVSLLATLLFLIGANLHFSTLFKASEPVIYGDAGDGLFNLWVLEHVVHTIGRGSSALADGRIFWPAEPYTYWWSDNLLVPAVFYGGLRAVCGDIFVAYRATVLFLSLAVYAAFIWLFVELWRGYQRSTENALSEWTILMTPVFAYLAFFSQIRLHDYQHFQHLASLFLVTLMIGALRHVASLRSRDWMLMLISQCLLLYSAPYYAVLGLCIVLCRLFFLLADKRINLWTWGWRHGLYALPVVLACVPAALLYGKAEPIHYTLDQIRALSLEAVHLVVPMDGWVRSLLESVNPDGLPVLRGGGYPGIGLLMATVLAFSVVLVAWRYPLMQGLKRRPIQLFLLCCALTLIGDSDFRAYAWGLRLLLIPAGLFLFAWYWRQTSHRSQASQFALLIAMLVTVYGTAFGPGTYFKPPYTDVSVWSVFSWLVPGYLNMREVLRFSSLGQLVLLATLWVLLLHAWRKVQQHQVLRWVAVTIVVVLVGLQLSETVHARVRQTRIVREHVALEPAEAQFFRNLEGAMLAIPTLPYHHNTFHQLRWVGCPDLHLLNGYSARSTDAFDALMRLEHEYGRASDAQIAYATELGADYVCVLCGRVSPETLARLQNSYQTLFVNDRFLVIALNKSASRDRP